MRLGPAPHVRIAVVDGDLVVFDIIQDEYLAVACEDSTEAIAALSGRSYRPDDAVLTELLDQGLILTRSAPWEQDARLHPAELPQPRSSAPLFRGIFSFVRAVLGTYVALQRHHTRWSAIPAVRGTVANPSPDELASIVARFESLRILVPGTGRCLVQSMILLRFLAGLHIEAEWVFGVRTHPFEAHCWVEREMLILNDSADHARWFTVIARF
jgi:translation initiation factor IF-1